MKLKEWVRFSCGVRLVDPEKKNVKLKTHRVEEMCNNIEYVLPLLYLNIESEFLALSQKYVYNIRAHLKFWTECYCYYSYLAVAHNIKRRKIRGTILFAVLQVSGCRVKTNEHSNIFTAQHTAA